MNNNWIDWRGCFAWFHHRTHKFTRRFDAWNYKRTCALRNLIETFGKYAEGWRLFNTFIIGVAIVDFGRRWTRVVVIKTVGSAGINAVRTSHIFVACIERGLIRVVAGIRDYRGYMSGRWRAWYGRLGHEGGRRYGRRIGRDTRRARWVIWIHDVRLWQGHDGPRRRAHCYVRGWQAFQLFSRDAVLVFDHCGHALLRYSTRTLDQRASFGFA